MKNEKMNGKKKRNSFTIYMMQLCILFINNYNLMQLFNFVY